MRLARFSDKRRFPRWGAAQATFRVQCGVTEGDLRLLDFSAEGMSVVFERARDDEPNSAVPLLLSRGDTPFARIVLGVANGIRSGDGELCVGGPILSRAFLPFGAASSGGAGDASQLRDEALASDVLVRLRKKAPALRLALEDGRAFRARIRGTFEIGAPIPLVIEAPSALPLSEVSISFGLDGGGFALHGSLTRGELASSASGDYALAPPFALVSRSRRHADRVRVPSQRAVLSWPNLLVPGERVMASVEDLSALGARVRLRNPSSSYPPPPGAQVLLHVDGLALALHAEVRHVDHAGAEGPTSFGVRFVPRSTDDVVRLARAVERFSFPTLYPRTTVPRSEVADLLRSSGYLELRDSAEKLRPWHDSADERLSIDAVHRRKDGLLDGHVSCTRIYGRTWLFHQLATLGQGRLAMSTRRAIYLSATGWVSLLSEGHGYAMAYFDRQKAWHSAFFESFIRWSGDDSIATITPLDRFELSSDPGRASPAGGGRAEHSWDVGEARPDELASAEATIRAAMHPLLARATDIEAGLLTTSTLCPSHAAEGLERARALLVARDHGEATAFALCETGSSRLSLFNLLNIAHVVVSPAASLGARRALLAAIVQFYAERGTAAPLVVAKPGTLNVAEAPGFALVETMGCLVLSSEGLKQYRNFLAYHFGRFERPNEAA
jgi:PilZ domain